jgi:hypothetical protein
MSFAMDDASLTSVVQKLQGTTGLQNSTKTTANTNVSEDCEQPSESFQLSQNFENKVSNIEDSFIQTQEQGNIFQQASKDLESIKKSFNDIKGQSQTVTENDSTGKALATVNKNINQSLKDIETTAKKSNFNGQNLLDGSMSSQGIAKVSLDTFGFSSKENITNNDDAQITQEKALKAAEEISNIQVAIAKNNQELINNVNSYVEITTKSENEAANTETKDTVDTIKSNIQKGVFSSPKKSVKIQIKSLSKELILAMVNLKQG